MRFVYIYMLIVSGNKYVLLSSREEKGRHLSHERFISFFQGDREEGLVSFLQWSNFDSKYQYDILRHILRQTTLGSQQDVHVLVLESALQFAKNFNSCMWREKKDVWIINIILLRKTMGKNELGIFGGVK